MRQPFKEIRSESCELCGFPFGEERSRKYDPLTTMPGPVACHVCVKETDRCIIHFGADEQVSQAASVAKTLVARM